MKSKTFTDDVQKVYWTIGEVAKHLDVSPSLLRFWEKEFSDYIQIKKNRKGIRSYTYDDLTKIERLYELIKIEQFTLKGAKRQIQTSQTHASNRITNF